MIKNIKAKIFSELKTITGVDVHLQSNDESENTRQNRFPLITYHRIAGRRSTQGKRTEFYQITARAMTNLECEELRDKILQKFNKTSNEIREACIIEPFSQDIRDVDSGADGIPMTFKFVMRDFSV